MTSALVWHLGSRSHGLLEDLDAMTKEKGFQFWYQLFANRISPDVNTELPTHAIVLVAPGASGAQIHSPRTRADW